MSSSSKRKRPAKNPHATQYEIVRSTISQPSATSRTITFDRHATGRLGEQTEIAEVSISAEDLAILAQDPQYSSLPDDDTLNFEYFEQSVQEGDKDDEPIAHKVPANKVKPVSLFALCYLLNYTELMTPIQNIYQDWLPFRDTHVHELARHDGWADLSKVCVHCGKVASVYKCEECYGPTVYCRACVVSAHARLPLHRIKVRFLDVFCVRGF